MRRLSSTTALFCTSSEALSIVSFFFFFQAEDGIRDYKVTGVQTCALPILQHRVALRAQRDALVLAGQEAAAPQAREQGLGLLAAGPRRRHDHERRQVGDRKSVV